MADIHWKATASTSRTTEAKKIRLNRAMVWWWESTRRGLAIVRSLEEQGILPKPK